MVCPLQRLTLVWGTSTFYTLIGISFIIVTICHAGNGDLSEVEVDMTAEDYEHEPLQKKLRCHHCYRNVHGEACVTLGDYSKVGIQECLTTENYCVVERFMTDQELTTFTRKCATKCTPGCESAGDNYKLEYCYSCCKSDFCNIGNTARFKQPSSLLVFFTSTLACALTVLTKMMA